MSRDPELTLSNMGTLTIQEGDEKVLEWAHVAGIASEVLGEARWMVSITTPRAAHRWGKQRTREEGEEGRREKGMEHRIGSVHMYM